MVPSLYMQFLRAVQRFIKRDRNIMWLIAGLTGVSGLAWLMNSREPTNTTIPVFFLLLFATIYSFSLYVTTIVRHSILLAGGVAGWLCLRYLELREPFYLILWVACLISLEVYLKIR